MKTLELLFTKLVKMKKYIAYDYFLIAINVRKK